MDTLKQYLAKAKTEHWAVGHFNFSTAEQLRAIVEAASDLKAPVMVATSEGEAKFVGYEQAVALVKSYQVEGHVVWLNADHHHSFASCKKAIDAGYDTVLIDASKLSLEENITLTKQVVDYAHSVNPMMSVEGELGYLRGASEVQEKIEINSNDYTQPEAAKEFVVATGVDRLAVVFGNIHGIVTEQREALNLEHLGSIIEAVPDTNLVLHGASGLSDNDIANAIAAGVCNVHINTELRLTFHDSLMATLHNDPTQSTPYKFLAPSLEAMKELIKAKIVLFGSAGRL